MMERRRVSRVLRVAAVAVASGLAALACDGGAGGSGNVAIGLAGPLQLSYGRSMQNAAQMAAEEINAAGGIDGRRLELIIRDDGADPQRAISIANEFVGNASIVAVVGHITSGATLAAAGIYNAPENGLLELSPTASSPLITEAGDWTFRLCPSDLEHGPALAQWLRGRLGGRSANVLYANDAYGRGVRESFVDAFVAQGGAVLGTDPFLPAYVAQDASFFDPFVERAILRRIDAIVVGGLAPEAIEIIRSARANGFGGRILGADGLLGVEEAGAVAEGVFVSTPFLPDMPGERTQRFVAAYTERFGVAPDAYAALTYDGIHLVARAIREEGADREAVRDWIAAVGTGQPAYEGVTGRIAFDANGDVAEKPVVIGVVRGGAVVSADARATAMAAGAAEQVAAN
ncbi:MAG TPA: ABC transporter substrate-binding protein [Longimicrobiales bacterium]